MDLTITLTDAQAREVAKLDPRKTVQQIVQAHVDAWLKPLVEASEANELREVGWSYRNADPVRRRQVRAALGLNGARDGR